jgi:hypothetical protein
MQRLLARLFGVSSHTLIDPYRLDNVGLSSPITRKEIKRLLYIAWDARAVSEKRMSSKVQVRIRQAMIFDPYMSRADQFRAMENMDTFFMKWYRSGQPPTRAVVNQFMRLIHQWE